MYVLLSNRYITQYRERVVSALFAVLNKEDFSANAQSGFLPRSLYVRARPSFEIWKLVKILLSFEYPAGCVKASLRVYYLINRLIQRCQHLWLYLTDRAFFKEVV